jgi:hypothetical protein
MKKQANTVMVLILEILILNSCSVYKTEMWVGENWNIRYQNTYIKTNSFEGVIFSKDYIATMGSSERFTPTTNNIDSAEAILHKEIKKINVNKPEQGGNCRVIHKNMKKYRRQYFGYYDTNGDKIIFINCFWEREGFYGFIDKVFSHESVDNKWKTEEYSVLDGCSYYWSIKVNLTTKTWFDFRVNGNA